MFVRVKDRNRCGKAVQIVESLREGTRIKQRVVKHVGVATDDAQLEVYRAMAARLIEQIDCQRRLPLAVQAQPRICRQDERVRIKHLREDRRVVEGVREVFGHVYDELGLMNALSGSRRDGQWNEILRACVLARLADPVSKRKSVDLLVRNHGIGLQLEKVYRMMNHVAANEERVKELACVSTLSLFRQAVDVLFFDVTTLYFESIEKDEVRNFGFSKDCKFKQSQVVLALVTTTDGMPITYELFPGNTFEGNTLVAIISDLRKRFDVRNVTLVADRAMFSEKNLALMEQEGIGYIVAAKLRKLPADTRNAILAGKDFYAAVVADELHWLREFETGNTSRRLIVGYSPRRARKDAADRERLLDRVRKKLDANDRLRVAEWVGNRGDRKFLRIEKALAQLDESKVAADAQWDGLHGVMTNMTKLSAAATLSRYRELWQIEAAFRLNKHDLAMRPIYHWTPKRIRAHVAICYLAYVVAKHAMHRLNGQVPGLSFESLREQLMNVQASHLRDASTGKRYRLPSRLSPEQRAIDRAFGLRRTEQVERLLAPQM